MVGNGWYAGLDSMSENKVGDVGTLSKCNAGMLFIFLLTFLSFYLIQVCISYPKKR